MTRILITFATLAALVELAAAAPEVCGNGADDDSDGFADEGCWPAGMHKLCESPMSCKVTGDIAPKSGGIVYQLPPDLDPKVAYGPGIPFIRRYVSLYEPGAASPQNRRAMGAHWQHNWQSWLDKTGSTVVVHLTTGQDVAFAATTPSGGFDYYVPQAGYHFKYLRQPTGGGTWELRTLTGETFRYDWTSPSGKLLDVSDSVGNKVTLTYDASNRVSTVTDASLAKRLNLTYQNAKVIRVNFQTISSGTPTTRTYIDIDYTGENPTEVHTNASTAREVHTFDANNYLTLIEDGSGNDILGLGWLSGSLGKTARVFTGEGGIGFEYNSSHAQCTGGTILFFNVANSTSCNVDTDCGGSLRCGGKTGTGSTGVCYRAARCLQSTSPSEDLITTVTPLTPCTGACAPTAEYSWNTSTLDLVGIKKAGAGNEWTSFQRDSNGMVTWMAEGDSDNNPTNGVGLSTFFFYDTTNPGKVTEVRRRSSIRFEGTFVCDSTPTGSAGCKRSRYNWNATTGLLDSKIEDGWTYNSSNSVISFSYTTGYTYDSVGRTTLIAGPLPGVDDNTEFTYYSSTDVFKNGYPDEVRRKKDASSYLTTKFDEYDYFGNAKSEKAPDNTLTCRTFDANRNYVSQVREAMNGQTTCGTTHASDLITSFVRDSWLRLTKTTRPLGDCEHKDYDTNGRLTATKLRDDCVATNAGDTQQLSRDTNGLVTKGEYKDSTGTVTFKLEGSYYDGLQLNARLNPVATSYSQSMTYAADGEFEELTFENGIGKTKRFFDDQNRETIRRRYLNAGGVYNDWDFAYPAGSPARKSSTVTDDLSKIVTTNYDDLGRKTRVISPDSGTTLHVYDAASRLTTLVEAYGAGSYAHTFTYDYLGRKLTENYVIESCGGAPTEVAYTWDASPGTCPSGASCANQAGRLAYVKTALLCDAAQGDLTLDQMTYFGYDAAGRTIGEYITDDTGRIANQSYVWDKNGNTTQVVPPSGVAMGFTFGGAGNSDANRATTLWRNNGTTTNLLTNITWAPFGPVTQYDQANTMSGGTIRAMLTWNLAYRASQIKYRFTATGADRTKIDYTEDEKGRYTAKVYSNVYAGMLSDYLQYDWLDRPTCDAAVSGACPTSGSSLKTRVNTYNASNDRTVFRHYDTSLDGIGFGDFQYNINHSTGSDKINSFTQTGAPGSTGYGWDPRGSRTYDDESTSAVDRRDYTYDGRRRVRTVTLRQDTPFGTPTFVITNAYDHRDRRVSRTVTQDSTYQWQWFYYYDLEDRLVEVKFIPSLSDPSTYSIYQFYWLGKRPIAIHATSYPSGTTGRFFLHSDESNRPLEAMNWPTSGDAAVVWALNPDAFGWDRVLLSSSIYQPFRLNGAYFEDTTNALKSWLEPHRPALLTRGGVMFDPQTETFLQRVGSWPNEAYSIDSHNVTTEWEFETLAKGCSTPASGETPAPDVASGGVALTNDPPGQGGLFSSCWTCNTDSSCPGNPGGYCVSCGHIIIGFGYRWCQVIDAISGSPGGYTTPPSTPCAVGPTVICLLGVRVSGSGSRMY